MPEIVNEFSTITFYYNISILCYCHRYKCKSTCLNRVQHPISQKLQLFWTAQIGWGVRSLNDIPRGSSNYTGGLLKDQEANKVNLSFFFSIYFRFVTCLTKWTLSKLTDKTHTSLWRVDHWQLYLLLIWMCVSCRGERFLLLQL